jgi:hypothetical protein
VLAGVKSPFLISDGKPMLINKQVYIVTHIGIKAIGAVMGMPIIE